MMEAAELGMWRDAALIVKSLREAGFCAYVAGGCVRDRLLGLVCDDVDVACSAHPNEVLELFPQSRLVGAAFGVVLVPGEWGDTEVATFREDGVYRDGRHPERVFFSDAEHDAKRRDFTVNGLFEDPLSDSPESIIDYVGGLEDIRTRTLRAIGDPDERFREDALRLIRGVRFAVTRGLSVDKATFGAMCRNAELLKKIAPERIRDEWCKILLSENSRQGIELLMKTGMMRCIVPELYALQGCTQPPHCHPEGDVLEHSLRMLEVKCGEGMSPTLPLMLASLLHDIGKPACRSVEDGGRIRFKGHEEVGAMMTKDILQRLKFPNEIRDTVRMLVEKHGVFAHAREMSLSSLRRLIGATWFREGVEVFRRDVLCSNGNLDEYEFLCQRVKEFECVPALPPPLVNGDDLKALGLRPGPMFRSCLDHVRTLQLDGLVGDREEALRVLAEFAGGSQN